MNILYLALLTFMATLVSKPEIIVQPACSERRNYIIIYLVTVSKFKKLAIYVYAPVMFETCFW